MRHNSAPDATHPGTTAGSRDATIGDLPVVEGRYHLAGVPTVVLEGGGGPPVVLLHGPGQFAPLRGRVVPGLTEMHRVVVPDLPGHGATGQPLDGPLDAERWLAWLRNLVARTCSRPPALVGHLAGGALALRHVIEAARSSAPCWSTPPVSRSAGRRRPSRPPWQDSSRTRPSAAGTASSAAACTTSTACAMRSGIRWDPFAACALDGMRRPGARSAVLSFVMAVGMRPISRRDLARTPVPGR